jgi:DNA polymerase
MACRPWLVAELNLVSPSLVVVLGSVAAQSLLGPAFRVTRSRGEVLPWPDAAERPEDFPRGKGHLVATVHPSSVLRADDREAAYEEFLKDLRTAFKAM